MGDRSELNGRTTGAGWTDPATRQSHATCALARSALEALFGGIEKPAFTSANAQNHLITLAEMAMYLLAWAPQLWSLVGLESPHSLTADLLPRYNEELFAGLVRARKPGGFAGGFAAVPSVMGFPLNC